MADTQSRSTQPERDAQSAARATVRDAESKAQSDNDVEVPEPGYDWFDKSLQWGVRAKPGSKGLTIDALNIGIYGEVPDYWDDQTRMPRGAYPQAGVPPIGFALRNKYDLWADNAADLYEEAIQRRWIPASDIPWNTIEPLPDDVETAMCQLCTELIQHANVEIETIGNWQQNMSYGFHEVKLYLASEMFDSARAFEAFRKRALSNGGGLGLESKGSVNRMILESKGGWTETSVFLHLLRGVFTMTIYRYGEKFAHSEAEKVLFARSLQDKARHVSYGLQHLKYAVNHQLDKRIVLGRLLAIGENVFVKELDDPVLRESLAIIFGGGVEGIRAGLHTYDQMMADYVRQYLAFTEWIGIGRSERLSPGLRKYLEV